MKTLSLALMSSAALALAACGDADTDTMVENDMTEMNEMDMDANAEPGTIVDVAAADSNFSTLASAVTTANLAQTLNGDGPFTVFAPTNAAFDKVDDAMLNDLMSEGMRDDLANVLTYHVVEGEVMAADLMQQIEDAGGNLELTTVNGATLTASVEGNNVMIMDGAGNSAMVQTTDVDASNGVIHAIDSVLMPTS